MAKSNYQPIIVSYINIIPGIVIACLLIMFSAVNFTILMVYSDKINWYEFISDISLLQIISFTFYQAFISTILSVIPAIFVAKSIFQRHFIGKKFLLNLCSITISLPVIIAIFGLITVYGRVGWISKFCYLLGINYSFIPYGLTGILLAHVFLNFPLAIHILFKRFESIAAEQHQLALQLGMNQWQYFIIVEWPYIKKDILKISILIFILCFSSFTVVMTLGGGPAATTIELAIYQLLNYDLNLNGAAVLALIQLFCCLILISLTHILKVGSPVIISTNITFIHHSDHNRFHKWWDTILIVLTILFLLPPILAIIIDGFLNFNILSILQQPRLWQACINSILIAIISGIICIIMTMMLLWSSIEFRLNNFTILHRSIELSGLLIYNIPSIIVITGVFLLYNRILGYTYSTFSYSHIYFLIIIIDAVMAIPYVLKILEDPMYDLALRYNLLCLSLQIHGINRILLIEFSALKNILRRAFAFACTLSIGDFGIIACLGIGNEKIITLPNYLYQQLSSYHNSDAAVTALLIIVICFCLFSFSEYLSNRNNQHTHD